MAQEQWTQRALRYTVSAFLVIGLLQSAHGLTQAPAPAPVFYGLNVPKPAPIQTPVRTLPAKAEAPLPNFPPAGTSVTLTGKAYDGPVDHCTLFFDKNGDYTANTGETKTTILGGSYSITADAATLKTSLGDTIFVQPATLVKDTAGAIVRVVPNDVLTGSALPCYDTTQFTYQYQFLALASSLLSTTTPAVISPATTLHALSNINFGLSAADTKTCLSITEPTFVLGTSNAYARYAANPTSDNDWGKKTFFKEVQLVFLVSVGTSFILPATAPAALYPKVGAIVYQAIGKSCLGASKRKMLLEEDAEISTAGRKLLAAVALDFTDPVALNTFIATASQDASTAAGIAGSTYTFSPAALAALVATVQNVMIMIAQATDITTLAAVQQTANDFVLTKVAGLASGTITPTAFATQTSPTALQTAVTAAVASIGASNNLVNPPTPAPTPAPTVVTSSTSPAPTTSTNESKSLSSGAIAGIVIGAVVGIALIAGIAGYVIMRNRAAGGAGGNLPSYGSPNSQPLNQ